MSAYTGIDYGRGLTNIDTSTGIRYGVISQHSLASWFYDEYEPVYGPPMCPVCGNEATDASSDFIAADEFEQYNNRGCVDYACYTCKHTLDNSDVYPDEPIGHELKTDEYHAVDCLDSDVMLLKSPFYTYAPFCSPCVPGAGNLDNAARDTDGGIENRWSKTFCFGHDYFENNRAPYRVFRVDDNSEVLPEDIAS